MIDNMITYPLIVSIHFVDESQRYTRQIPTIYNAYYY